MDFSRVFDGGNGTGKPPGGGGLGDFDDADPAPEFKPVPAGVYFARVARGEFTTTRAGADAYKMKFEVTQGEHAGRTVTRLWTLSPKALPYAKRDLLAFGLNHSSKLLNPFPDPGKEYHVRLVVALQKGDDGIERNDVKKIDILRIVDGPAAGFGLPDEDDGAAAGVPA